MRTAKRCGIDLGGTKIAGIVLDEEGTTLAEARVPTPREDYEATLEALAALIRRLEEEAGELESVGLAHPGSLSPTNGRLRNANSTWLNERHLGPDLAALVGRPVALANDANCLALSESYDGAALGASPVFAVILGTGVGGSVVVAGRPLVGANAIAGEWGHLPLPWPLEAEYPGPACWCGRRGCVETWLSGPGLAADHAQVTGETLSGPEIVARAEQADPRARATLGRFVERLARALALVLDVVDPELVVIGGGLSRIDAIYEEVPALWERHAFTDALTTRLVPARHGDASGVRGAARLPLVGA